MVSSYRITGFPGPVSLPKRRRALRRPAALPLAILLGTGLGFCYPAVPQQHPAGSAPAIPAPSSSPLQPPSSLQPASGGIAAGTVSPRSAAAAVPPEAAPDFEDRDPATGLTPQEWNRIAVQDAPPAPPKSGRAPRPSAQDKRDIYPRSTGVMVVQDNPDMDRVYPVDTLTNHATVFQVPGVVQKAWCGDLQAWTLEGEGNFVSVKPLAADLSTNLSILTTSGRLFMFRLWSHEAGDYTDLFKILGPGGYQANINKLLDDKVAAMKDTLTADYDKKLKDSLDHAQFDWAKTFAATTFPDYRIHQVSGFRVVGVWNDAAFTYFSITGDEKPTVFLESKSSGRWTRELLNFDVTAGSFYRVQKLLQHNQRLILKLRDDEAVITREGRS